MCVQYLTDRAPQLRKYAPYRRNEKRISWRTCNSSSIGTFHLLHSESKSFGGDTTLMTWRRLIKVTLAGAPSSVARPLRVRGRQPLDRVSTLVCFQAERFCVFMFPRLRRHAHKFYSRVRDCRIAPFGYFAVNPLFDSGLTTPTSHRGW